MIYKGNAKIRESGSYGIYHGSNPIGAIYKGSQKVYFFQNQITWNAGTTLATYTVPKWVTKIHVDCVASKGYGTGGKGGRVECDLNVTAGQTLYITVGSSPTSNVCVYNASDIRTNNAGQLDNTSLQSRLVVAGGGGNQRASGNGTGGLGGGTTGGTGGNSGGGGVTAYGGAGGTQSSGGTGGGHAGWDGRKGNDGTFGLGGTGRNGGGGGAGWYGGGGGGQAWTAYNDDYWAGGGGGSSYTNSTLCSNVTHTQGYQNGAGYITITEIE